MKCKYKPLSREESDAIKSVMTDRNMSQLNIARGCGSNGYLAHINRLLQGNISLTPSFATKLLKVFGDDSRLGFLKAYQKGLLLPHPAVDLWQKIYRVASGTLESLYVAHSPEVKGAIIGDLEKLIEKYQPK